MPDQTPAADPCNAENLPDPGGQGHTVVLTKLIAENPQVSNQSVPKRKECCASPLDHFPCWLECKKVSAVGS